MRWRVLGQVGETRQEIRVPYDSSKAAELIGSHLKDMLLARLKGDSELVFLCIGTDRSTGDALGPLVGQSLAEMPALGAAVLGTLDHPVHASNLVDILRQLQADGRERIVVAVDACLGQPENVGTITVGPGALRPGAGVNKNLPPVGHLFITGTVNVGGMLEYLVLQNTRLSLVMRMASTIVGGIVRALEMLKITVPCAARSPGQLAPASARKPLSPGLG